jgi:predicted Holliday junction resolvase-like endonuclease
LPKKLQFSRIQLLHNITKGKLAEELAKEDYKNHGYKIIKTGIGSDFIAIKRFHNEKPIKEFVEVKTGKAKVSKKQKSFMKKITKSGNRYTVYRVTDAFLDNYLILNPDLHNGAFKHAL